MSRTGLTGAVVLLLVVAAVLSAGSAANAAPGIDTAGPGAGTVRVVDDAGKGDR